jgi:DNA replication and repair protein RecF
VILRALRVWGWRNLAPVTLQPGPRATVLYGQNGQGKSNVLEAVYFVVTFRSFRTHAQDDLVRWGEKQAAVEAEITTRGLDRLLRAQIGDGRKTTLLDGKTVRRDASALEGAALVLFSPEDLRLAKAAASERRRFIDRAVFAGYRPYYREAVAFERALKSRNALLRRGGVDGMLLESYDEELATTGARIVMRRRDLVRSLSARFSAAFKRIHGEPEVSTRYRSDPMVESAVTEAEVRESLRSGFIRHRASDERRGFTGFGPQTDDLELLLGGRPARDHGSQGQLRSLVLALKIAELEHLSEALGEPPLLLLDDVASELDRERRTKLFESISALDCQTLITVTEREHLPSLPERVDWEVVQGSVESAKAAK